MPTDGNSTAAKAAVAETRDELLAKLAEIQSKLKCLDSASGIAGRDARMLLHHEHSDAQPRQHDATSQSTNVPATDSTVAVADEYQNHQPSLLGLVEWDRDLFICRLTPQAEEAFGWKAEEVLGKRWQDFRFVHEDDIERVIQSAQTIVHGHVDFYTCFNRNYRKDGTVVNCEWFNSVHRDAQGRPISWVSLAHDVTHRVRAENQVRQSRNAMRLIIGETSRSTGVEFFEALVHYICESFGYRYAFISQLDPTDKAHVRTIAFWADGQLAGEHVYRIAGTPCETVIDRPMFYPIGVQSRFPQIPELSRLDAQSYLGFPLISSTGKTLGILAVFDDKPMEDRPDIREIIELFANRTAIEIERTLNEAALHAGETRLRVLTEQMPAILWTTDHDLRFTHATGAALKRINHHPRQVVGKTLFEFFKTNDPRFRPIAIHQNALLGVSGSSEIEWFERVFQVYVEPLCDSDGRIIGTIGVAQDITDLKCVERSLVASQERFRRLVEHAPEAVVLLDTDTGRFVMVNQAAEQLYKMSADELCQLGPLDLSPAMQPDGRSSAEITREVIAKARVGETPMFEWTHLDSQGREIPCEIRLLSLQESGSTIIRGSVTDVTDKKQAEESRKRLEHDLAHVARVSTMGEMVGGLAHELNQPLYAIQNFGKACGNLVADGGEFDRDQLQEWLDKITSTAQYAGEILIRLRSFVSREPIKKTIIDLGKTIETALMLTKYDAQSAGIQVEYSPPQNLTPIKADAVQIQQVLVNLLRNAFDAIEENFCSDPFVKISVESTGEFLAVTVTDNGAGLPLDPTNIFAPFRSTKSSGLGLGLAIAKTIVEAHGGTLVAKNRPEGGANFRFTLAISHALN